MEKIQFSIIFVLVAVLVVFSINPNLLGEWKNREKVYSVELIKLEGCPECGDINSIAQAFSTVPTIKIKKETALGDYNSKEAKKILEQYGIKKIPALIIISKNIDKIPLEGSVFRTDAEKNAAIFDQAVPYLDLASGKVKGEVIATIVEDSSCDKCADLAFLPAKLEQMGVKVKETKIIKASSPEGKEIMEKKQLKFLPSLLFSKDLAEYWWIFPKLKDLLSEQADNYLFTEPFFPLKEISSGKIKGLVKVTYLTADNCDYCFNVSELKPIFQPAGIYFAEENTVTESSDYGKVLIKKYNITKIPTLIFSSEIIDYSNNQKKALKEIGSFEPDDTFVLRGLDAFNVKYKELNPENTVINSTVN